MYVPRLDLLIIIHDAIGIGIHVDVGLVRLGVVPIAGQEEAVARIHDQRLRKYIGLLPVEVPLGCVQQAGVGVGVGRRR